LKSFGSTEELVGKLSSLSLGEENGIPGVKVKFVEIGRNTCGEGDFLA